MIMPEIFKKRLDKEFKREPEKDKDFYDPKQAELLGDFFDKVVPARIAVEIVKDYKRELKKGVKGINKNKYENSEEYEKSVKDVSNKISNAFKILEEEIYRRHKNERGEVSVNKIELDNVFEGKSIVFVIKEGDVAKREYKNMLRFREFLPNNAPKIYDYQKLGNDGLLTMEKIEGKTLKQLIKDTADIYTALEVKPRFFSNLGKIIAVMDNNNFIHRDLYNLDNIMLSEDYGWKIIDLEKSRYYTKRDKAIYAQTFISDIEQVGIEGISDKLKNESIKNDFYEGYLLNRNLKEDIHFVAKEKSINFSNIKNYIERTIKTIENISMPSKETRNELNSLISEIDLCLSELGQDKTKTSKKRTEILEYFKKGLKGFLEKKYEKL